MDARIRPTDAPFRDARYAPPQLDIEERGGGELILSNPTPFSGEFTTMTQALDRWAAEAPARTWLAERSGEGDRGGFKPRDGKPGGFKPRGEGGRPQGEGKPGRDFKSGKPGGKPGGFKPGPKTNRAPGKGAPPEGKGPRHG